jgi:4a-hydroxytetrahydrobiopterin dehydratase
MLLTNDLLSKALEDLPGWTHEEGAIRKEFVFKGFKPAIAFIDRLAVAADEAKHHPDLFNSYNRVVVSLTTHDEGGVTQKDVDLARSIESAADPSGS